MEIGDSKTGEKYPSSLRTVTYIDEISLLIKYETK